MDCKWFNNDFETCTNGDCPFCADFCPVTENQEVCRYSDLDDTETMLRRCLDAEKEDSREAIQALAEENKDLKKQLEKAKAERDAAVDCCSGYCASCLFVKDCAKHDMNDAAPTRWYYGDCEDWEWRGQKED